MNTNNQLLVFKGNENLFSKDKIIFEDFGIIVLQFKNEKEKMNAISLLKENNIDYFENEELNAQSEENEDPLRNGPIASYPVKVYYDMTDVFYKDVTVAVLDTGFTLYDERHKDRILPSNFNFTTSDTIEDLNQHGTQVASIILESTSENVKILPIKILEDGNAQGSLFSLYQGIMCAVEQEVDIINISAVSKTKNSALIDSAIEKAKEKGIIIVAAAGNNGEDVKDYCPANNDYCVTIGAIDDKMYLSESSNFGDAVDYYAFGSGIPTYNTLGEKAQMNGTSASAASVTALIASLEVCAIEYDLDDLILYTTDEEEKPVLNIFNFFVSNEEDEEEMVPVKDYDEIVYSAATKVDNVAGQYWNLGGYYCKSGSTSGHASITSTDYKYMGAFYIWGDGVSAITNYTASTVPASYNITDKVTLSSRGTVNKKLSTYTTYSNSTVYTMHGAKTSVIGGYYTGGSGTRDNPYVAGGGRVELREGSVKKWPKDVATVVAAVGGHSLTFHGGGATGGSMPTIYRFNNSVHYLPLNAYTRTGYTFGGWYGQNIRNAATSVYSNGAMFPVSIGSTDTCSVAEDTMTGHLYAIWNPISYNISYNLNGGTHGSSHPTSAAYGSSFTVSHPSKTGHVFTGWTITNKSGLQTATSYSNLTSKSGDTVYFTANWSVNSYKLSYNYNGGTISTTPPASANYGSTFTVVNPSKEGYTFTGWTITNTSSGTLTGQKGTSFLNLRSDNGQTVTFTANWTAAGYTVDFTLDGGNINISYPLGASVDAVFEIPYPTKSGYKFLGWNISGMDGSTHTIGDTTTTNASAINILATTFMNLRKSSGTVIFTALWKKTDEYKVWLKYGQRWLKTTPYIKTEVGWIKTIPYVYDDSEWKQGK